MENISTTPVQAVEAAIQEVSYDWGSMQEAHPNVIAAAALRAAADQVVPVSEGDVYKSGEVFLIAMNVRLKLLALAAELEGR